MQDKRTDAPDLEWQGKAVAVRLAPSVEFLGLNNAIQEGAIQAEDAALADAFVLGYCAPATVIDEDGGSGLDYVILSDYQSDGFDEETDNFAKLFSTTDYLDTHVPPETPASKDAYAEIMWFMWGWVWRWQMRGADDEKEPAAVIITGKQAYAGTITSYYAGLVLRVTTVSFSFDEDGKPSLVYDYGPWYHTTFNNNATLSYYFYHK
jgi:hypothetical protein